MKHFSKKLISLFAVCCLLAALVIPSGIFAVSAEESQDTGPVYEFKFSEYDYMANGQTPYFGRRLDLKAVEKDKTYTLSFDYQIMGDTLLKVANAYHSQAGGAGTMIGESDTQSYVNLTGSGKFTYDLGPTTDFDAAYGIGLHFEMNMSDGEDGFVDFKISNLSLTEKGSDVNLLNANNVIDAYGVAYPDQHDYVIVTPDNSTPGGAGSDTSATNPVYKLLHSQYDWEAYDYNSYVHHMTGISLEGLTAGTNVTLSFDYFVVDPIRVIVFNPYCNWAQDNKGTNTRLDIEEEPDGTWSCTFPVTDNDLIQGYVGIAFEQNDPDNYSDIYIWNVSLKAEGSDENLVKSPLVWDGLVTLAEIMPADFDPSTLVREGDDEEGDDSTGDDSTGDDNTGDDNTGSDNTGSDNTGSDNTGSDNTGSDNTGSDNTGSDNTGSDNTGSDNTGDDNTGDDFFGDMEDMFNDLLEQVEGLIRFDEESGITIIYEDEDAAFDEEEALYISQYEDGDLDDALLELIGDKKYVAYDILLALGEDVVDLDGTVSLMIPLPEDFDEDATVIYATNAYGELVEIEFTVEDGYIVLSTDVLGTFVVVEGELDLAGDGADDKQDAPVVDDGKDDAKDDGKDDAKDDANDSDDADDKVDSDSPATGEAVGGVLFAALILAAAAAALVVSKKRTA